MTPAVKSRGIIFRGDMVRAILAGAKTQTRRVVKLAAWANPHHAKDLVSPLDRYDTVRVGDHFVDEGVRDFGALFEYGTSDAFVRCPYGVPGNELWVRETWHDSPDGTIYRATKEQHGSCDFGGDAPWRPSIFMPRSKSRLTLVVESVRVERLSAITEEDAKAEGFEPHTFEFETQEFNGSFRPVPLVYSARDQYRRAFRAMHKLAADADPWLWVIGFRKQGGAS